MSFLSDLLPFGREPTEKAPDLTLYHFTTCPFCVRTRAAARRLGVDLEKRNIRRSREAFDELVSGGGKKQVPCLRIEDPSGGEPTWMYESDDIVHYLEQRFA